MRVTQTAAIGIALATSCGNQTPPEPEHKQYQTSSGIEATSLEEDLQYFSSLYEGEFSNFDLKSITSTRHYTYRQIPLPDLGEHVVYVQQQYGTTNTNRSVYRQRIYHSYVDHDRNEIVTRIFTFSDDVAKKLIDTQFDPTKVKNLTATDFVAIPNGCEIFWSRDSDSFIGYQKMGDCVMSMPNTETNMVLADDLILTPTYFSTHTRSVTEQGEPLFGNKHPTVMPKARILTCKVHKNDGLILGTRAHDLGYEISIDEVGAGHTLIIRRKENADYNSDLVLDHLNQSGEIITSTTSALPTALTIGDVKTSCTAATTPWNTD